MNKTPKPMTQFFKNISPFQDCLEFQSPIGHFMVELSFKTNDGDIYINLKKMQNDGKGGGDYWLIYGTNICVEKFKITNIYQRILEIEEYD